MFEHVLDSPCTMFHSGIGSISLFPAAQHMSGQTSIQVIDDMLAADLGKRHFSKWEAKAQQEAIRRCGLAASSN